MKRILFIGNSYTFFHDMPTAIFAPLAESIGYSFDVTAVTRGGYRLSQFADPENEEGARLRRTVAGQHYDCVVLQEQSCTPSTDEARFLRGVADLRDLLGAQADHFVLYATWGRKEGSPQLSDLGLTRLEMTDRLALAYDRAATANGMTVAHVGCAFAAHLTEHPEDELYNPDLSHPSELGSRVAAETILGAVIEAIK